MLTNVILNATAPTLSGILDDAQDVLQSVVGWVGDIAQAIYDNKMIFIFFALPLAYVGFKVFRKLCSVA